jgi:hypothetical protein
MAKPGLGSLLLLGAAAFGAYKYSQMSEVKKRELMDKGKKLVNENLGGLTKSFARKTPVNTTTNGMG